MKIELSIYTTKKQRMRIRKMTAAAKLLIYATLLYILPIIEFCSCAALIVLFCCVDSGNTQFILRCFILSGSVLFLSAFLDRCIRSDLRQLQKRYQSGVYGYRRHHGYGYRKAVCA